MNNRNKNMFVIAALLATSTALDLDDLGDDDRVGIKAEFSDAGAQDLDGNLVTNHDYRVAIERVSIRGDAVDVRPRDEVRLNRILQEIANPTIEVTAEPVVDETELVLNHVHFEGRVYDDHGRLPTEGLGISGQMPLNVVVKRTDSAGKLDVRFQVPSQYFDGIDYAQA